MKNKQPFQKAKSGLYLPKEHHTVSDWDRNADAKWELDTGDYISTPSSLKLSGPGSVGTLNSWLCRIVATRNLPQGRLISYFKSNYSNPIYEPTFRNQVALGSSDRQNCYSAQLYIDHWRLLRYVNGMMYERDTGVCSFTPTIWERLRLTWWNGVTPEAQSSLVVSLDIEVAGEWVQQGDWLYDTANMWAASEINRCGPGVYQATNRYYLIDDTQVWGPE